MSAALACNGWKTLEGVELKEDIETNWINLFLANILILYLPENTRKPLVFWFFQGV